MLGLTRRQRKRSDVEAIAFLDYLREWTGAADLADALVEILNLRRRVPTPRLTLLPVDANPNIRAAV